MIGRLFFQRAHVSNKRFDFVVGEFAAEGLHCRLAVLLNAVFDCCGRFRISEGRLLFGSVKSMAFSIFPIFVSPLPVVP